MSTARKAMVLAAIGKYQNLYLAGSPVPAILTYIFVDFHDPEDRKLATDFFCWWLNSLG